MGPRGRQFESGQPDDSSRPSFINCCRTSSNRRLSRSEAVRRQTARGMRALRPGADQRWSTSGPTTTSAFRPARMNTAICFRTASERMCSRWGDGKRYRWVAFSAITTIEAGHLRMDRITTAESPVPKQKAGPGSRRSHVQIVRPDQGYDQCLGTVLRAHKATHSFLYYGPAGASELTHELLRRNRLHANVMVRKCI